MCRTLKCPECDAARGVEEADVLPKGSTPRRKECGSPGTKTCHPTVSWSEKPRAGTKCCPDCRKNHYLKTKSQNTERERERRKEDPEGTSATAKKWRDKKRSANPEYWKQKAEPPREDKTGDEIPKDPCERWNDWSRKKKDENPQYFTKKEKELRRKNKKGGKESDEIAAATEGVEHLAMVTTAGLEVSEEEWRRCQSRRSLAPTQPSSGDTRRPQPLRTTGAGVGHSLHDDPWWLDTDQYLVRDEFGHTRNTAFDRRPPAPRPPAPRPAYFETVLGDNSPPPAATSSGGQMGVPSTTAPFLREPTRGPREPAPSRPKHVKHDVNLLLTEQEAYTRRRGQSSSPEPSGSEDSQSPQDRSHGYGRGRRDPSPPQKISKGDSSRGGRK